MYQSEGNLDVSALHEVEGPDSAAGIRAGIALLVVDDEVAPIVFDLETRDGSDIRHVDVACAPADLDTHCDGFPNEQRTPIYQQVGAWHILDGGVCGRQPPHAGCSHEQGKNQKKKSASRVAKHHRKEITRELLVQNVEKSALTAHVGCSRTCKH